MSHRKNQRSNRNKSGNNNNNPSSSSSSVGNKLPDEEVLNEGWGLFLSLIVENQSIEWGQLHWLELARTEARREQLKVACTGKTDLLLCNEEMIGAEKYVVLDIGELEFNPNQTEDNNEHFRSLFSMLGNVTKLRVPYSLKMETFVPALLSVWTKFNGKPLVALRIKRNDKGYGFEKKAITKFWKAICAVGSLRSIRFENMPKFPPLSARPMLTHIESMTVSNYPVDLTDLLCQLGENIQKLNIFYSFAPFQCELAGFERLLELNPNFGRKLTKFRLYGNGVGYQESRPTQIKPGKLLEMLCKRCPKMETLIIQGLYEVPIDVALDNLSLIRNTVTDTTIDSQVMELTVEMANKYEPFEKMRVLRFSMTFNTYNGYSVDVFRLTVPRLFPNLEKMFLYTTDPKFAGELKPQMEELFPRMLNPSVVVMHEDTQPGEAISV